jgi:hypothetical protein
MNVALPFHLLPDFKGKIAKCEVGDARVTEKYMVRQEGIEVIGSKILLSHDLRESIHDFLICLEVLQEVRLRIRSS